MRFSELDGRAVALWGLGVETRSFLGHLEREHPRAGVAVLVLEQGERPADAPPGAEVVDAAGAVEAIARRCDLLVRSPGVSIYRPEIAELRRRGVPVVTPTGLWLAEREGRNVLGVTATKGKSTTAKLIAHLVAKSGCRVHLGGNIGVPALDFLHEPQDELAVIELSSYQIADLPVGPETAMASNLHQEHLNWHITMDAYRHDKLRLLSLPGVRRCVVNATSAEVMAAPHAGEVRTFGVPPGWHVVGGPAVAHDHEVVIQPGDLPLIGPHNALNVCGALTALEAIAVPLPPLPASLADFEGLEHRLQIVHEAAGVTWVDDSISTEPHAATFAVESFPDAKLVLIGGGFDRGQDYAELGALLARRTELVVGLPTTGTRLVEATRTAGGRADLAADLTAAVELARAVATPGTVVLLSPAAPSFTTHKDFRERGDQFAALARRG